jgi:hypothetical protein
MEALNIENLKKYNSMIKDLRQNGLYSDNSEAYKAASKIYDKGQSLDARHEANPYQESLKAEQPKISDEEINMLVEKKLQQQMNSYQQKFENSVTAAVTQLSQMLEANKKQLELLKQELSEFKSKQPEVMMTQPSFVPHNEPSLPQQPQRPMQPQNPRAGNYNPEDVSIDKMFYCGHK